MFCVLIHRSFGIPATLLEIVPVAGILFSFTNTVGAALWAADMEEGRNAGSSSSTSGSATAPNLRNQADQVRKREL